jgi:Ni,Fe-hydrogenase I large subunit
MPTIKIDPLNRIEGHVAVEVVVDSVAAGNPQSVKVYGTMFRGFENILARRDPRDAPVITQRI